LSHKIIGLTKKAIYYYEQEGLFSPKKEAESGYRVFFENGLTILLEISVEMDLYAGGKSLFGFL